MIDVTIVALLFMDVFSTRLTSKKKPHRYTMYQRHGANSDCEVKEIRCGWKGGMHREYVHDSISIFQLLVAQITDDFFSSIYSIWKFRVAYLIYHNVRYFEAM